MSVKLDFNHVQTLAVRHKKLLVVIGGVSVTIVVLLIAICWWLITPNGQFILNDDDSVRLKSQNFRVGLVLGAGVDKRGKPYRELQGRLDLAAKALAKGEVQKLLLSGDNRFQNYDEPTAMYNYLVNKKGISPARLQRDFAGRSTYESCERASKIFGQQQLLIISAKSHLPRAIYLCRHMNIEAYGLPTDVEANNSFRRELLARVKAVFNIYILGERTVLGAPIKI